jgi:hypothetical protein
MFTLYVSLNKAGNFGHEAIKCETREEAKALRAELFASDRFDISFALILTNEEYAKEFGVLGNMPASRILRSFAKKA